MLSDLITALQIFLKYGDLSSPTHCEHDCLTVCVNPDKVTTVDKIALSKLGFDDDEDGDFFKSYRFGSA